MMTWQHGMYAFRTVSYSGAAQLLGYARHLLVEVSVTSDGVGLDTPGHLAIG